MNRSVCFAAAALTVAAMDVRAESLNGLCVYLEYQVIARNLAPRHWYFLPDGRYLNDAPKEELTPQGMELTCAKYPSSCGKYAISGAKLNLTPRSGKPWAADFKHAAGGNLDINDIPCEKITASYPANAKLNGRYTSGQSYGGISSASTYAFNPDGTFTTEVRGMARSSAATGLSSSAKRGTYKLSANTLELAANGQTTRLLIYEIPAGTGTQMMIDGYAWKKN
ncbi:MAG: hypothetical protein ACKV2U_27645 [Bryobacteraceae bacterium]